MINDIIHISDVHIGAGDNAQEYKRLVAHFIATYNPKHIAIVQTGDLVERATMHLFDQWARLTDPLLEAGFQVCAVPGNHDVFTTKGVDLGLRGDRRPWARYVEPRIGGQDLGHGVREWRFGSQGQHQLLGLDTQLASSLDRDPDAARGQLGHQQLAVLTSVMETGCFVAGHHRLFWRDALHLLEDAGELLDVLNPRAAMYLCGHQHRYAVTQTDDLIAVAAPRSTQRHSGRLRYQEISLSSKERRWCHIS